MSLKCKNGRGGGNGLIKQNNIRYGGSYMLYAANAVDTVDIVYTVEVLTLFTLLTLLTLFILLTLRYTALHCLNISMHSYIYS